MKIADGISMLGVPINIMGRGSRVYLTLIWDDENVILVDSGAPGSLSGIKNAMEDESVPFERLTKIIVTHQDIDHIGGIRDILDELSSVNVLAHEEDKPYIQGEKRLVRLNTNFMNRINALPEEEKEKVLDMFGNISVKVDMTLKDGEELDCCGGIKVIHTPGHTPGHICLYHEASKTLIVGDAMNVIEGQLTGPNRQIMNEEDVKVAMDSLRKFEKYDVENVISYHGGFFNDKPNERIEEVALRE